MNVAEVRELFNELPRERIAFLPTPFHRLNNLSEDYGMDLFIKREDMTGPSNFGGNKTRKLEFIMGKAVRDKIDYVISIGGYQTNSAMELVQFANLLNIKSIVYLGDVINQGIPTEYRGNLLLMQMLGAEINFVLRDPNVQGSYFNPLWDKMLKLSNERKSGLTESSGYLTWTAAVSADLLFQNSAYTAWKLFLLAKLMHRQIQCIRLKFSVQ